MGYQHMLLTIEKSMLIYANWFYVSINCIM
jgi:hypothetical protein